MKTSFNGRFVALLAGSTLMLMSGVAQAAIANSKHDLSSGTTNTSKFSGTAEICVFCHTPHGSDVTASVPLWNKALPLATTFTTYSALGTTSLTGQTAAVGSVSVACLSCHDGAATVNSVINAPGSGLTSATYTAGTWSGTLAASSGKIPVGITQSGKDLRDDHPIGIQYGGGKSSVYVAGTGVAAGGNVDPDFQAVDVVATKADWFVNISGVGKQKTDLLLYTRNEAGITNPAGAQPFVECSTCHDPHSTTNATFLRTSNAGSALCLACHNK